MHGIALYTNVALGIMLSMRAMGITALMSLLLAGSASASSHDTGAIDTSDNVAISFWIATAMMLHLRYSSLSREITWPEMENLCNCCCISNWWVLLGTTTHT